MGVIYALQNGAPLADELDRVNVYADFSLPNPANHLGDGAMAPANRGLTSFGRLVIERLNARRIITDLSHSVSGHAWR
jgi:membrane dipeptidase